jgi:hypothetical protein
MIIEEDPLTESIIPLLTLPKEKSILARKSYQSHPIMMSWKNLPKNTWLKDENALEVFITKSKLKRTP